MVRKALIGLLIVIGLGLILSSPVMARKKLTRQRSIPSANSSYGAWVKPKLRGDRRALLLMLGGMQHADSVDYVLTYKAGPVPQGIESYHTPEDGNTQKELVFGTCSHNDCTYHGDITDMQLTVTLKLKDDRTATLRYQINP